MEGGSTVEAEERKQDEKRQGDRRQGDRRQQSRRESDVPLPGSFCNMLCFKLGKSQHTLYKIIGKLPAKQRVALLAHEYAGLSINETALITGSPRWAVTFNIKRARDNVLRMLEEEDPGLHEEINKASIQTVMDQYAEESITDEQIMRVFGPVSLLLDKEESKKPTRKLVWFYKKNENEDENESDNENVNETENENDVLNE